MKTAFIYLALAITAVQAAPPLADLNVDPTGGQGEPRRPLWAEQIPSALIISRAEPIGGDTAGDIGADLTGGGGGGDGGNGDGVFDDPGPRRNPFNQLGRVLSKLHLRDGAFTTAKGPSVDPQRRH